MSDLVYRAEHEVKTLRAKLVAAEDALMTYARCGDDDPDTYERLNLEYSQAFDQLELAEERLTQLDYA